MSTTIVDARGLRCPMPLLKARKALSSLEEGAQLEVWATDSGAEADFKAYCEQSGHALLRIETGCGDEAASPWLKIVLACHR